jgi:arylsulfatase
MDNGKPPYTYNFFGLQRFTIASDQVITDPNATISLDFQYDGGGNGKGGTAILMVNGQEVARGRVEKTQPGVFSADETADVGVDDATQVADLVFDSVDDSEFSGYVNKVTIKISE